MAKFEPKIQALLCKWCASAGADLAGVSRMKYPSNILPIQVMCSGRVDPIFILRAFEAGADGVLIGACHPGDCHYVDGNIKADRRITFVTKILEQFSLANRLKFEYVSASEGRRFKELVIEFTEKVKDLGPTPIGYKLPLTQFNYNDQNRKKRIFHQQVKSIAEAIGYEPDKDVHFDPDEIMEGYGFPVRDPDKCIGCYACYNTCPENIITLTDIDDKRIYGTLSHACRDCKECEEICPEDALKVQPGFKFISFLWETPVEDISHPLLLCQECNSVYTPVAQIDHIQTKIDENDTTNKIRIPEYHYKYCPDCRRQRVGAILLDVPRRANPYLPGGN